MKINASPETVRAVTQVFKLAGILDDRVAQPDKHRVVAWSEMVERHKLIESDLLDGLQSYYDSPSERAIQIGDLIHHSKLARRDRCQKEEDEQRREREARYDARAEDDVRALSAAFFAGRVDETPRLKAARAALETCRGRKECGPALAEFFAAKREAAKPNHRKDAA